eukprot:TRINITY_DN4762_c0_g2_i2.p1 TRINITY_DN4762_c0_g2~~TRINITY_DN4762_c0_g2_i2.p1  ORF type:complete len:147 (-),score=32.71 TRINITY_DN4762_c0_g2_i2:18-458(-)
MCTEQYMMHKKALLFKDVEVAEKIMKLTYHPDPVSKSDWDKWTKAMRLVKNLGREVANYDDDLWSEKRFDLVYEGVYQKFKQNEKFKSTLLSTGDSILVEASATDKIWGIGMTPDDPRVQDPNLWLGTNLLGKVLMKVREGLRTDV